MSETEQVAEGSRVWLPDIVLNVARHASPNEIACTWRFLDKSTSNMFSSFRVVRLSLPSPARIFKLRWGSPGACRGLTHTQRLKLLCLTAASGSLPNLEVALDSAGLVPVGALLEAAAGAGQLEACQLLLLRGCPWADSLAAAARGGHRHVCEWALASGCPLTSDAVYAAARGGHEGLMGWLLQLCREGNSAAGVDMLKLLSAAAVGFELAVLQLLHDEQHQQHQQQDLASQKQQGRGGRARLPRQPRPFLTQRQQVEMLAAAAGSPTPDWQAKVGWLEGLGCPRTTAVCAEAARVGQDGDAVGRLQWLIGRGYPVCMNTTGVAALQGDLAALRLLVEQAGAKIGDSASCGAADRGHMAVLEYLDSRSGFTNSPMVGSAGAYGGHLPVVAWAVSLGNTVIIRYPNRTVTRVAPDQTPEMMHAAAASGSIELMAWLCERGWTWNECVITAAASSGCEEALEWLLERGCPWPVDGQPYMNSARSGDLAMVRCLHRLGCPWGPDLLRDACRSAATPVPVLHLLVGLGCPADWNAMAEAAEAMEPGEYRTALLEWLDEERQRRQRPGA